MNHDLIEQNPEVFYFSDQRSIVMVDDPLIEYLVKRALENPSGRARVCTHASPDDELHEMLIVHTKDVYVRPHKHLGKIESFSIIKGACDIIVFEDNGEVRSITPLGEYGSGRAMYYRLSEPLFHALIIRSDVLVFHEVTQGPFKKNDTVFASWAPKGDNKDEVKSFLVGLI